MEDAQQRKRFCEEIDCDFSVIAPAGVGKTFSIVERIYNMACSCPEKLKTLCVITYTKKAAEALKCRVSERLQQHSQQNIVLSYLAQSFFGTIHSLCWQHIRLFQNDTYTLLPDDHILRESFLTHYRVNERRFKEVAQLVDLDKWLDLTENFSPNENFSTEPHLKTFSLDFQPVYDYVPEARNRKNILQIQRNLRDWVAEYQAGKAVNIPDCSKGGKGFIDVFYKTLQPFLAHLSEDAVAFVKRLTQDYFEYRIQYGYLKHNDLVFFAERCLKTEKAQKYFSENTMCILLDEAQDTDEHQFRYLQTLCAMNSQNRFSMVGDPQQAIYTRANVQTYLDLHRQLIAEGKCEALVFSKTFRCPQKIVQALNQKFPHILCRAKDAQQVDYVPLVSASALEGNCKTITVPSMPENEKDPVAYETQYISNFLKDYLQTYPRDLSDVCLLVPRNNWLEELQHGLSQFGWGLQIYSHKTIYRDNLFYCAILSFIHLINFPEDSFEIAGVLHGIFNISETDITLCDQPLQIAYPCCSNSPIATLLESLLQLRQSVIALAPWVGIETIIQYFRPLCPINDEDRACEDLILETAFQSQSTNCTWCAFEVRLQYYRDIAIENEYPVCKDLLQGFSCHKAKGLEWPTVILPFFYRPIRYNTKHYPFLLDGKIIWNKYSFEASTELLKFRKRELQRLLYVSCTRAQQHLVILDDCMLWEQEISHPSLGQLYAGE